MDKPVENTQNNYEEYFSPELKALDNQYQKNEELYNEVHKSLDKNLTKIDGNSMFGAGSPHREVAELGKVLNDIRGNQVAVIKEKSNIKKTIKDFEFKQQNAARNEAGSENLQVMMKDLISNIQATRTDMTKPSYSEKVNNKGAENLSNLKPEDLGINENDLAMIDRFRGTTNSGKGKK